MKLWKEIEFLSVAIVLTTAAFSGLANKAQAATAEEIRATIHVMVRGGEPGRIRRFFDYMDEAERASLINGPEYKNKPLRCSYNPNDGSGSCSVHGNHINALRYGSLPRSELIQWMASEGARCVDEENGVPFGADVGSRLQSTVICTINLRCNNQECLTR